MFYIVEVQDSDGNDCTVYDALVQAPNRETAVERVFTEWVEVEYPFDEEDGGYGTYHPCDCRCGHYKALEDCEAGCSDSWECSHGGLLVSEPEEAKEYPTEEEARACLVPYHSLIDLSELDS